jgi:triosephosphate isomerase
MRKRIVAGNWKMNKSYAEAIELTDSILSYSSNESVQHILIPPAVFCSEIVKKTVSSSIIVGIQNSSEYESGAYTGEVSALMVKSIGVEYVLVGHSERRQYFGENNQQLALKINQLLKNGLIPIFCCGELLDEREMANHFNVIKNQLSEALFHLGEDEMLKCIVAYEPVWAIGTGVTASSYQAQEMHQFIRKLIEKKYGSDVANSISILYGGSCNPNNAQELFANPDVDGGLIGGASLNAKDFIAIANSF